MASLRRVCPQPTLNFIKYKIVNLFLRNSLCLLKNPKGRESLEIFAPPPVVGMIKILSALVSLLSFRVRRRASLELDLVALRHQVSCGGNALVSFGSSSPTGPSGSGFTELESPVLQ